MFKVRLICVKWADFEHITLKSEIKAKDKIIIKMQLLYNNMAVMEPIF